MKSSINPFIDLIKFFTLTYLIAWVIWIPLGIYAPEKYLFIIIGAFSPTISSLLLLVLKKERTAIRILIRKLFKWKAKLTYYLFAVLFPLILVILSSLVYEVVNDGKVLNLAAINNSYGIPSESPLYFFLYAPLIFLATFIGGPISEELGWRGYAQPKLATKIGVGKGGFVIGVLWSLWHLPLFYFFPDAVAGIPLLYYLFILTSFSILFSWLSHNTKGSVLLAMILHAGMNFALGLFKIINENQDEKLLIIFTTVMVITAAFFGKKLWNLRPTLNA